MTPRVARLRPQYEGWYPKISSGVWHNAAWVAEMVLQQQRRGSPTWALEGRLLSDTHFEFQGYGPKSGTAHLPRRIATPERR